MNQVAIITGAANGIGRKLAIDLIAGGNQTLILCDIDSDKLRNEFADQEVDCHHLDVTKATSWQSLIDSVRGFTGDLTRLERTPPPSCAGRGSIGRVQVESAYRQFWYDELPLSQSARAVFLVWYSQSLARCHLSLWERSGSQGPGEGDYVEYPANRSSPLPAATASDLPRCAVQVAQRSPDVGTDAS